MITLYIGLTTCFILTVVIFILNVRDLKTLYHEKDLLTSKRRSHQLFIELLGLHCNNIVTIDGDKKMILCKRGGNRKYVPWHVCRDCVSRRRP